jgi:hypothetical protein
MQADSQDIAGQDFAPASSGPDEDHELHATGKTCARCHRTIGPTEDVRKNASGEWVHEQCPAKPS